MLDQQLSRAFDGAHARYIEFRSLWSSELVCTKKYMQALDSLKFFANVSKALFCQTFYRQSFLLYGNYVYYTESDLILVS